MIGTVLLIWGKNTIKKITSEITKRKECRDRPQFTYLCHKSKKGECH